MCWDWTHAEHVPCMSPRHNGFDPNQKRDIAGQWEQQLGTRPAGGLQRPPRNEPAPPTLADLDPEVYARAHTYFAQVARGRLAPFGNTAGADDAVQDAFESILTRAASQGQDLNDLFGSDEHRGLRARVISTTAGWQHPDVQNKERHEYIKARKELASAETKHHAEHGRGFTGEERQAAAEQIRMQWPAKSRPRADFYVKDTFVSFDTPTGDDATAATIGDLTEAPAYLQQHEEDTSDENAGFALGELRMAEEADLRAKEKGEVRSSNAAEMRAAVRSSVWNDVIVTGSNDLPVPPVREQHIPKEEASRARRIVKEAGGPGALVARWLDKDPSVTPEQEHALFAPFSPETLPPSRLEAAALAFDDRPQFADRLWGDALAAATRS